MSHEHPYESTIEQKLRSLRRQIKHCESFHRGQGQVVISSGCTGLDDVLPNGGFRMGGLIEWLAGHPGSGVDFWAMNVARQAQVAGAVDCQPPPQSPSPSSPSTPTPQVARGSHRAIVVIDQERMFYPPAAAAMGIDLQRLLVFQPRHSSDAIWAMDQALRCPAVAAVWARVPRLDPRDFRRLQLAAEQGGSLGLLLRPLAARGQPSWADVRLLVEPRRFAKLPQTTAPTNPIEDGDQRQWCIRVLRCRGGQSAAAVYVEMDATGQSWQLRRVPPPASALTVSSISPSNCFTSDANRHGNRRHEKRSQEEAGTMYLAAQLARSANHRRSARA